jgi:hypothetical protein
MKHDGIRISEPAREVATRPGRAGLAGRSGGRKSRRSFTQPHMGELEDTEREPGFAELMDRVEAWAT